MTERKITFPLSLMRAATFSALLGAGAAQAAVAWDEAVNGDLSGDPFAPNVAGLGAGSNGLFGTTGRAGVGGLVDRDYLSFTVPAGHVLAALNVLPGTTTVGGGSFIGLAAGGVVTTDPEGFSAEGLLGWTLYGPDQIGTSLLDAMSVPSLGSTGFEVPLPAGTYTVWIQETAVGTVNYALDLVVAEVPEAPTGLAMLAGLALLGAALRRR
jgi:hypothetical protein